MKLHIMAPPCEKTMPYDVYLLASRRHGTLYLGVTNNLARRVDEHKRKVIPGFFARYDVSRLVWYEAYDRIDKAIAREKSLKKWRRDWKITLIEEMNPDWTDLYPTLNRRTKPPPLPVIPGPRSGTRPEGPRRRRGNPETPRSQEEASSVVSHSAPPAVMGSGFSLTLAPE